jgi:hypothetical protein
LFRRTKSDPTSVAEVDDNPQRKGRATPTRREAEARNKAKAKTPRTRKEIAAARREARAGNSAKMRQAMRTGDERYLPARDQGPVRRFVRDYVDSRFLMLEVMLPVMVVLLILPYFGTALASFATAAVPALLLLVLFDAFRLRGRLRKELDARFADQSHRGTTSYAIMRAMQVRMLRQPKPQVRMGAQLPGRYR